MPALYHQPQRTLKSMLKASFMEENKKILGNTCWHPHQFSLTRPQTQRVMHFLMYKYEKITASDSFCTSSGFGWGRRSWAAPVSPSLDREVRPFWASRNLLFSLVVNSSANNHTDSCTTWKAQRNQSLLLCKEVSDYSDSDENDLLILWVKKQN